jgi:ribosomal protein S18 acetylase RimI-like enzyme
MSHDGASWDRMLESMWSFFKTVPEGSHGGRCVELPGVLAGVTPAVPERSLPNSVAYRDEDALLGALDELAAIYHEAGVLAWTVWVPYFHERAKRALADAGHVLDADPEAMIGTLADIEPPREDDPEPDPRPRLEDLARVNDLAYGSGDAFERMMGAGQGDPASLYIARVGGRAAASTVSWNHGGDCSIWWVATVPEARGRGLAPGLMRRALAAGRDSGCEVTTLQATKAGQPVYEKLGYRGLGAIEMWERRKPSPGAAR